MICSGNTLPLPAYGVVYDIDVQGHVSIKKRTRRAPLRYLSKLYELLKKLLKARLISFYRSPWASPIVIVPNKNDVDIRLYIDCILVDAVTASTKCTIPFEDPLLTELDSYQ